MESVSYLSATSKTKRKPSKGSHEKDGVLRVQEECAFSQLHQSAGLKTSAPVPDSFCSEVQPNAEPAADNTAVVCLDELEFQQKKWNE
ncbi:MAG: hypothetical protein ACLR6J_10120 [Parabacteroides merdae]